MSELCLDGPPPRAWGRARQTGEAFRALGSTPTCVGKSWVRMASARIEWVHPHVRGEEFGSVMRGVTQTGPPPRAWGRGSTWQDRDRPDGSTPTCVGKRRQPTSQRPSGWVHPHVRGEERRGCWRRASGRGPPPRAWGRERRGPPPLSCRGSTPTCVGKRATPVGVVTCVPVHPHVRGEEPMTPRCWPVTRGPPPRAWGREPAKHARHATGGSTPTCVGKRRPA